VHEDSDQIDAQKYQSVGRQLQKKIERFDNKTK